MGLDIHELQQQYERTKGDKNFLDNFVKMPEGKGAVVVRLLPPAPAGMFDRAKSPFYQWTRIHKVNGKSIHDPREMVDGKWQGANPVAEYLRWLWKESEKAAPEEQDRMRKLYRELKPVDRYYYNVIVRSEVSEDGTVKTNVGPKILSVGKTIHALILRGICGDKEMEIAPLGDVTDFKTGRDFKIVKGIRKSGNESYPEYNGSHFLDPAPAGTPEECERWMKNLHDLAALRILKPIEEMQHELQVHLGLKPDTESDFDPSAYQKSDGPVVEAEPTRTQVSVPDVPKSEVKAAETTESASEDDGNEVLADDDFLEELRNMG